MKIKTVLISAVVLAGLAAGGYYGARYMVKRNTKAVEVMPVSNANQAYFTYDEEASIVGVVTSDVSQTEKLNEEYEIAEVFVKEGDAVKEGTPLFAYDMTLPELELELRELELRTRELELLSMQKELEKLQRTRPTASLIDHFTTFTMASAQEEVVVEEYDLKQETEKNSKDTASSADTGLSIEIVGEVENPNLVQQGDMTANGTAPKETETEKESETGTEAESESETGTEAAENGAGQETESETESPEEKAARELKKRMDSIYSE